MALINFKPKQVVKRLLSVLPERGKDVVSKRYGIEAETERMTLDSIGQVYGITRERVRQIENASIAAIKKSDVFSSNKDVFAELERAIHSLGGVIPEEDFLIAATKDPHTQNHLRFMLVLHDTFCHNKEDDHFHKQWFVDEELADRVHTALHKLVDEIHDDKLLSEEELIASFLKHLKDIEDVYKNEEVLKRWLSISKEIGKNPIGEWGLSTSPNIKTRGVRDYAFLVIRQHGSPMHFTEVAHAIRDQFGKNAHEATCHNELIKDPRFVLVGRGLYALTDWGYEKGVVKNVIERVLEREKRPMTRDEIIKQVLKERYVKENTILVNLQDTTRFKKDKDGKYRLAR